MFPGIYSPLCSDCVMVAEPLLFQWINPPKRLTNADGCEREDGGGAEENIGEDPGEAEPVLAWPVAGGVLQQSPGHDEEGDQHVSHGQGQQQQVGRLAESPVTQDRYQDLHHHCIVSKHKKCPHQQVPQHRHDDNGDHHYDL